MKEFDYDMISRYLDGEMNAVERTAFEEQIEQDADLKNEVALLRDVNETVKMKLYPDENEIALSNTLGDMRAEYFAGQTKARIVPFRRRLMMAAAAVLIMALILTVWQPWQKDLYKQYADIQMPAAGERGAGSDVQLKQATVYFNNKNFTAAIPLFKTILKDDTQNSFVQYYYAIALLQNGEIENSRKELDSLYNGTSLFRYDAAYYMALSYLKEKNKTACAVWLNKIPADAEVYIKAQDLLKKL
jgi:hypothetical protein